MREVTFVENKNRKIMVTKGQNTGEKLGKLIVIENKSTNIEREVDTHVKSIRALIKKLSPVQRQHYYNGMLAFILNEQVELNNEANVNAIDKKDYNKLSLKELSLIEEMSLKMQQLYNLIGDEE